jgi:hypothetical protein
MTYYILQTVKDQLGITDTNSDTMLNELGAESDAYVNNILAPYYSSLPLQNPDQAIVDASNNGVVGRYFKKVGQMDRGQAFLDLQKREMADYIDRIKLAKSATFVPQYFVTTTGNIYNENSPA